MGQCVRDDERHVTVVSFLIVSFLIINEVIIV